LLYRPDVLNLFKKTHSDSGLLPQALAGWFYSAGIREHLFSDLITDELIIELDQPVIIPAEAEIDALSGVPSVSILMYLVWSMLDAKLRALMSLNTSRSRYRFIAWFFSNALPLFKLEHLVAARWKSWLMELVELTPGMYLPRFAILVHSLRPDNDRPNLQTAVGIGQLRAWAQKQIEIKGNWHWLTKNRSSKETLSFPRFDPKHSPAAEIDSKTKLSFGLNLIGFAYGELGIGEDLRMAVAACEAADIPYRIVNIPPGDEIRQEDMELKSRMVEAQTEDYSINVFIMPGFDVVSRIFMKKGIELFEGHYNIGWWPWELPVWPKAWAKAFDLMDEIWAGSEFSHQMYQKATTKPSVLMPLAASVTRVKQYSKAYFKIPEDGFSFLYVFDFNSHLKRKNPEAAILAFKKAFPKTLIKTKKSPATISVPDVQLVLKVMNTKKNDPAWLEFEKLIADDDRIHIVNRTLDREEVLGLIQACDAYLSPHRAEGFGRTLAEAMLLGKPVIATNYSGNQFFMNPAVTFPIDYKLIPVKTGDYHFVKDEDNAYWADPSIDHMAELLQDALQKYQDKKFLTNLKKYSEEFFIPKRIGEFLKERLKILRTQI